jgi:deoxyribose-phosphate aldolase
MNELFKKYPVNTSSIEEIKEKVAVLSETGKKNYSKEYLHKAFSSIDLTTLNATDTVERVEKMCEKVNQFSSVSEFAGIPHVAAICVYPALVPVVKKNLKVAGIQIAAVSGGFPASQTFIEVKCAETRQCVEVGATEIDMVISVGAFLEENYQRVYDEIAAIKAACGKAHLKVILETGALEKPELISKASYLAMEAGADFIKTSTGKLYPPASIEAIYLMSEAIANFNRLTGKKIGLKPAGGISNGMQACEFLAVVEHFLGKEYIKPELFRIGASTLANNLLTELMKLQNPAAAEVKYF